MAVECSSSERTKYLLMLAKEAELEAGLSRQEGKRFRGLEEDKNPESKSTESARRALGGPSGHLSQNVNPPSFG